MIDTDYKADSNTPILPHPEDPLAPSVSQDEAENLSPVVKQQVNQSLTQGELRAADREQWDEVEASLRVFDTDKASRIKTEGEEKGIGVSTYQRALRHKREVLYHKYIQESIERKLSEAKEGSSQQHESFDEIGVIMQIVKEDSFLNDKVARDQILRDDYIHEIVQRLDKVIENPLLAAEKKLEAIEVIYQRAWAVGPQAGGVTKDWAKRRVRGARRSYALAILHTTPSETLNQYLQGSSDFAEYLKQVNEEQTKEQQEEERAKNRQEFLKESEAKHTASQTVNNVDVSREPVTPLPLDKQVPSDSSVTENEATSPDTQKVNSILEQANQKVIENERLSNRRRFLAAKIAIAGGTVPVKINETTNASFPEPGSQDISPQPEPKRDPWGLMRFFRRK